MAFWAGQGTSEVEDEHVDKMLQLGVIEPPTSLRESPVVLVPKKDGKRRIRIDYCRLNAVMVRESYPIPCMEKCMGSLSDVRALWTLDCN